MPYFVSIGKHCMGTLDVREAIWWAIHQIVPRLIILKFAAEVPWKVDVGYHQELHTYITCGCRIYLFELDSAFFSQLDSFSGWSYFLFVIRTEASNSGLELSLISSLLMSNSNYYSEFSFSNFCQFFSHFFYHFSIFPLCDLN